jgi:hypothetical protein
MDMEVVVALIAAAGSIVVAILNHHLTRRVQDQDHKIGKLYALSMSDDAFNQLTRLAGGNYGGFYLDPNPAVGLAAEINYFKILGYITFRKVADTRDLPTGNHPGDNLSDYITVTPPGRAFIALRQDAIRKG